MFKPSENSEMISPGVFCKFKPQLLDVQVPQRAGALVSHAGPRGEDPELASGSTAISTDAFISSKMPISEARGTGLSQGN